MWADGSEQSAAREDVHLHSYANQIGTGVVAMTPEKQMGLFYTFQDLYSLRRDPQCPLHQGLSVGGAWFPHLCRLSNHLHSLPMGSSIRFTNVRRVDEPSTRMSDPRRASYHRGGLLSIDWESTQTLSPEERAYIQGCVNMAADFTRGTCDCCGSPVDSASRVCFRCSVPPQVYGEPIEGTFDLGEMPGPDDSVPASMSDTPPIFAAQKDGEPYFKWDKLNLSYYSTNDSDGLVRELRRHDDVYTMIPSWHYRYDIGWKFQYLVLKKTPVAMDYHLFTLTALFKPKPGSAPLPDADWINFGLRGIEDRIMTDEERMKMFLSGVRSIDGGL